MWFMDLKSPVFGSPPFEIASVLFARACHMHYSLEFTARLELEAELGVLQFILCKTTAILYTVDHSGPMQVRF